MLITLSEYWRRKAIEDGQNKQDYCLETNAKPYGDITSETVRSVGDDEWLKRNVWGSVGQCAVCALFKRPWKPEARTKNPIDVDGIINVRGRLLPKPYHADLPIKPHKDQDEIPTVLVHIWAPVETDGIIDARGWLYGGEAKEIGKKRGVYNRAWECWFVPPPYRTMEELLKLFPPKLHP